MVRKRFALLVIVVLAASAVWAVPASAGNPTYKVKLDAQPPSGENWSFLRYFPLSLSVHQNDIVDAAWGGAAGIPHTATVVPDGNANAWRDENQGPGGPQDPAQFPWALQAPDTLVGGDDAQVDVNPAVAGPTDPSCGTVATPCTFDGSQVVSSGFQFAAPGAQPSFYVKMTAPLGTYSFLCLIHPGMQMTVNVVSNGTTIPDPAAVATKEASQIDHARSVDGSVADDLAQTVKRTPIGGGRDRFTIWAGGFWNQVSADEYPDRAIRVHVGDRVRVLGNFEIHTATFPKSSASTTPLIMTQCEVAGPDTPATSPADCALPTDFQIAFNSTAVLPTSGSSLRDPSTFVNSGVLTWGNANTFVADRPGTYSFVCLVHGPSMSGTIKIVS